MAKTTNPFDSLSDKIEEVASRLEYLISIAEVKPRVDQSPLLTTRKAAEFLGISPKTIYNDPERFHPIKLKGGGLRFRKIDLEELVTVSGRPS